MRKKLAWLNLMIFAGGFFITGKAQIFENFEQDSLTKWKQVPGNRWEISSLEPISGNYSLRQIFDSPVAASDRISISLAGLKPDKDTIIYNFKIRHGYNPSSSNRWAVFLGADNDAAEMLPGGQINGYVLGLNFSGSDDILKLWKTRGGIAKELINTKFNWEQKIGTSHAARLEVIRVPSGNWKIRINAGGGFDSLVNIGEGSDNEFLKLGWFGIYYGYTATKDRLLWFDDLSIRGAFIKDTIAPTVRSVIILNDSTLAVSFTEDIDLTEQTMKTGFRMIDGDVMPDSVIHSRPDSLVIIFATHFSDESWIKLAVDGICDLSGNLMMPDTVACFYYKAKLNDVCINEIMFDPTPSVRLPENEYVELFNRKDFSINLTGWHFSAYNESKIFPDCILQAGGYLILCHYAAVNSFSRFGKSLGLFSSGSFLNNSGSCLVLKDAEENIISHICYSAQWISDEFKKDGGWSLEKIDPEKPCSGEENWKVSLNEWGGTPGRQNSIYSTFGDHEAPYVTDVFPWKDSILRISFNEPVGLNYAFNPDEFKVNEGYGFPVGDSISIPDYQFFYLIFSKAFRASVVYKLELTGTVKDCAGNDAVKGNWRFALPQLADSFGMVFNEIMYHPLPGCPEYIELYNRSEHVYDLAEFRLGIRDRITGENKSVTTISSKGRLVFPGDYIVITANLEELLQCHMWADQGSIIQVDALPAITDEGAILLLFNKGLKVIDQVSYGDDLHLPLLANTQGISLERIDYNRPSMDPTNWHSASERSGYATPGAKNSQYLQMEETESVLKVEPEVFSPDNNGLRDVVNIQYHFNETGYIGNLAIYDSRGRRVRYLLKNALLGTEGVASWDGRDERGMMAVAGIYIVWLEVYNLKGKIKTYRQVCVLSR